MINLGQPIVKRFIVFYTIYHCFDFDKFLKHAYDTSIRFFLDI